MRQLYLRDFRRTFELLYMVVHTKHEAAALVREQGDVFKHDHAIHKRSTRNRARRLGNRHKFAIEPYGFRFHGIPFEA